MAGSAPNIILLKGTYYVRVAVPRDVKATIGKGELWESLKTSNFHDAKKSAPPVIAKFKRQIDTARRGTTGQIQTTPARIALANWAHKIMQTPPTDGELVTDWSVTQRIQALENAIADENGYLEIDGFDENLAKLLTENGCKVGVDDPIIGMMRQEAALTLLYGARYVEQARLVNVRLRFAEQAAAAPVETIGAIVAKPSVDRPTPSLTLSALFEEWIANRKPAEKEVGRLRHQSRRLIETVGDIPANYLGKKEIAEFMSLVPKMPGRKRPAELNALPMRELVARFEEMNADLIEAGKEPMPTLTKTTVEEWFASYKRMFSYGEAMDHLDRNPFNAIKSLVVNGAPSIKRRAFTDEEITRIFTAPLFNGYDAEASTRFREIAGATITKDAKYWLPILSLWHGGRLAEFAAMPLADVKQSKKGTWYFDLTERDVKTETSKRQIPLHPHMIEMGFLDYLAGLKGETWLFPELDHETRHGAGHRFSKWWGEWMDCHGMSDPTLAHHSWRHSWKRRARESSVKKEMHDVISGHKGMTVADGYGEGADIEALARDMALITFPDFPVLA